MSLSSRVALSVVVPCYGEEASLPALYNRVTRVCAETAGDDYEIVLVNDGSKDRTWPLIAVLAESDRHVVGVNLSRNHGHQIALTAGLAICRGARILVLDADLQDPPELLPEMLRLMDAGADVVYGRRIERQGESPFKRWSASLFYRLLGALAEIEMPADAGDFRLISRRALDVLNSMPEQHRFVRGMVTWIGFTQVALPYRREARAHGTTKYPLSRMIAFATDAITAFSVRPLRLSSGLAVLFALLGLVVMGYAIFSWRAGVAVAGWTSLMCVVLIMGSAQLFVLGIFGEYLGRLAIESKRRPLYVVKEIRSMAAGEMLDAQQTPTAAIARLKA